MVMSPADAQATTAVPWVPLINLNLAFLADGLGAFFALLVAGVGAFVFGDMKMILIAVDHQRHIRHVALVQRHQHLLAVGGEGVVLEL